MGVLLVEAEKGLGDRELKQTLLREIRRQGVPFGVRIIEATGGETATDAYNFQAFLGEVNLAAKVFPDGREEWIRGVNFVGTPLNAIRSIIAAENAWRWTMPTAAPSRVTCPSRRSVRPWSSPSSSCRANPRRPTPSTAIRSRGRSSSENLRGQVQQKRLPPRTIRR